MRTFHLVFILLIGAASVRADNPLRIERQPGRMTFFVNQVTLATYVHEDAEILRPYFCQVRSLEGRPVTRTHPPKEGPDATDHATMHPGIWLAFGDLGGADFWRNKASVEHAGFVEEPKVLDGSRGFAFMVRQRYRNGDQTLCEETCRHVLRIHAEGWWLEYDSEFRAERPIAFGDQEEMGLGIRLASTLTVKGGHGSIVNSHGDRNESGAWGKLARWCDYGGMQDDRRRGLVLLPHADNAWPSRFHVRDYGVMVANPIGQKCFAAPEVSVREIRPGHPLRLRFGVLIYDRPKDAPLDIGKAAEGLWK